MAIEHAIDMLYRAGWNALDTTGCGFASDGRPYPHLQRVRHEMTRAGLTLRVSESAGFGCYRAAWSAGDAGIGGEAVGSTADEAAIHALAQTLRRLALSNA